MSAAPLLALARAATGRRRARLAYRDAGGVVTRREVEVLALGWRWGHWVALAWCHLRGGLRVFELHRVEGVSVARRRTRPGPLADLDPREFALADLQDPAAGPARRVTLALPARLAPLAGALFPGAEVESGPGGARVHLLATDPRVLSEMVASLGLALG